MTFFDTQYKSVFHFNKISYRFFEIYLKNLLIETSG